MKYLTGQVDIWHQTQFSCLYYELMLLVFFQLTKQIFILWWVIKHPVPILLSDLVMTMKSDLLQSVII